ncbi:MAG: phospholipase D-like domain-containing protein [Saprospiraceae bacterium]
MHKTARFACLITAILPAFFVTNAFALAVGRGGGDGFLITGQPEQSEIKTDGFRITWKTSIPTSATVFYGAEPNTLSASKTVADNLNEHSVVLSGLSSGTVYWVRVMSVLGSDTVFSATKPFATQALSSGQIKVFFNQGYDLSAAGGLAPAGDSYEAVLQETLNRINAAQATLDVAMYNTNRSDLVNAVKAAHNRGVRVRYIAAKATSNTALATPPAFPVLYGNDSALMHNKFLVIDADLPDQAWVMSGSMNWTGTNMTDDCNNTVFVQDQSLARAYELEFDEMWGAHAAIPNPVASRFGSYKTDNTPHNFLIGGRQVSCYFSPTDQVTRRIEEAIRTADHQASFALFSFTKNELGSAMLAEHNEGTWVSGIIENINDSGTEYTWLRSNGVPVQAHPASPLLHHKYVVLDAGRPESEPTVVTGSHNWSQNAESNNDENTLIFRDAEMAALFQAEFERRWAEISTATVALPGQVFEVFPNPVRDRLIVCADGQTGSATIEVRDAAGRLLFVLTGALPTLDIQWPAGIPAGQYLITITTQRGAGTVSIQALPR